MGGAKIGEINLSASGFKRGGKVWLKINGVEEFNLISIPLCLQQSPSKLTRYLIFSYAITQNFQIC